MESIFTVFHIYISVHVKFNIKQPLGGIMPANNFMMFLKKNKQKKTWPEIVQ